MSVSAGLATLLEDRRSLLNARVANARSRSPSFDTAALSRFIVETMDPLLVAVLAANPDSGARFVDEGFDMAVSLVEHGCVGTSPRAEAVSEVWRDVGPVLAPLLASRPRDVLGPLSNAAIKLASEPGMRLGDWMAALRLFAGRARSTRELRSLSVLLAWRAGAAHLRGAALGVEIDNDLACDAVGATAGSNWADLVNRFRADCWWTPDRALPADGLRVGAFTGLGGRFSEPPKIAVLGQSFIATSGGRHFVLDVDAYGATLRPAPEVDVRVLLPASPAKLSARGQFQADDRLVNCDWPDDGLLVARTDNSIALVSRFSHGIHVFPRALP